MTDFTITDDFPKYEIEFESRFSNPKACYDYLFKQNGQMEMTEAYLNGCIWTLSAVKLTVLWGS
jgi:hypothetical protein